MPKIRLGGIKAFEKRAYLTSSCRSGEGTLADICSRLASDRINLSLLLHIAGDGPREAVTAACTGRADGFSSYIRWKEGLGECSIGKLLPDICTISIFPHDRKPEVAGALMAALAANAIAPHGFASSPSAMTILASARDFSDVIEAIFQTFEFPAHASALDWHAAYQGQEDLLDRVVCSFHEEVIQVYDFVHYTGFDLWSASLPPGGMDGLGAAVIGPAGVRVGLKRLACFGAALAGLHELRLKMPFLAASFSPGDGAMRIAFLLPAAQRDAARSVLDMSLPGSDLSPFGPVSVFFLHGPHFGDRYGIANALVVALRNASIPLLALSCTVSSISAVVSGGDTEKTIEALSPAFQTPAGK